MDVLLRDLESKQALIDRLTGDIERNAAVLSGLTSKAMAIRAQNEQLTVC
jgi:hypothetical protein